MLAVQQHTNAKTPRTIRYATAKNIRYQQRRNIRLLQKEDALKRVIPSTINSVGKLKEIYYRGYRSFELDVYYKNNRNCLVVGHHPSAMSNMCFIDFISHIDTKEVEKDLAGCEKHA